MTNSLEVLKYLEANGSEDFSKALVNTVVYGHKDIVRYIVVGKKGDVEVKDKKSDVTFTLSFIHGPLANCSTVSRE